MTTGYSGTPLAKKLGLKPGFTIRLVDAPVHYRSLFTDWPEDVKEAADRRTKKNFIHYFTRSADQLAKDMAALRKEIHDHGLIWVSWPKKSSKVPTDADENTVRAIALRNGLVDVKVCAVDEVWSGLKLVVPVKDRK